MPNTVQLTQNGQPVYPVTDVSLITGLEERSGMRVIPYTTRPTASAETAGFIYMDESTQDLYVTKATSGSYSWVSAGNLSNIDLDNCAKKTELEQLGQDVADNTENIVNLQQEVDSIQPIVIEGNVTNAPDEEDLTTDENDLLKFANRSTAVNQMGYVILRKNKTFAEQVTLANTIYEVRYNFNLSSDFTMPAGCTLRFNGGRISGNITLTGNDTSVEAGTEKIFDGISLAGVWNSKSAYAEWFGAIGDGVTDDSTPIQKAVDSFPVVFLGSKKYLIGTTISLNSFNIVTGNKAAWVIANIAGGSSAFKMGYFSRCEGFTLELPNANTIGFLVNTKYVQETALAQKFNPIGTGNQQTISRTLYSTMIENVYIFKEEVFQGTTSGTAIKIVAEGDQEYRPGLVNAQFKGIAINGQFDNGIDIAPGSGLAWTNSISFEDIFIARVAVGINLEDANTDMFNRYGIIFRRVDYQTPGNNANISDCYYAVLNFGSRIIFEDSIVWDWNNNVGHSPVLINPNKTNDLHFIRTGFDSNYITDYPFRSFTENKNVGRLFSMTESDGVTYNYRTLSHYLPTTTSPSDALTILSTMPDGVYTMEKTQLPSFATILNVSLETQLYELYMMVIQSCGGQFLVSITHSNSKGEDSGIDNYYAVFQKVETGAIEANRWKAQTYLPVPKGKTTSRPTGKKVPFGFKYFDTDLYKNIYAVGLTNHVGGIMWVGEDNLPLNMPRFGTNANKPTFGPIGFRYWDADNSKMIQIASGTKASITLTFVSVNAETDTFSLRLYTYENSSQAIFYSIYLIVTAGESVTTLRDAVKKELEKIGIVCSASGSNALVITAPYCGNFYTTLAYNGASATPTNVTEAKTQGTITWQ